MPKIYIGTGGYSDTDLVGTLYPHGTAKADFLTVYAGHYDCIEINSTFHAPIGIKAWRGMVEKARGRLRFSVKLHQDFSHKRIATAEHARHFLAALQPLVEQKVPLNLLIQFAYGFERNQSNRLYVAKLVERFRDYPLAIEFRHRSWHVEPVFRSFARQPNLIWCNVDYPPNIGLPDFHFRSYQRIAYLRLHGHNPHWWKAQSAAQRHDYRYTDAELKRLADILFRHQAGFDELYLYFQNTTNSHSFYNIATLKGYLNTLGFQVKTEIEDVGNGQGCLF